MTAPLFQHVALIGLGLIGSSLAWAMKAKGLAGHISGHARTQATRDTAMRLGFLDSVHPTPADAARGADLVVICTPVGIVGQIAAEIAPALKPGAIVSDVGSVKTSVVRAILPHLPPHAHLVAAHPVAGTENSGPESGFASLFHNRWCILTPTPDADPAAVARVRALWEGCGAKVEEMTPEHHDRVLAVTSHLPHLIAYTIVGTARDLESVTESEVIKFSAGGFRDFTRIAASDPTMWRDIFLHNREGVLELLGRFCEDLFALQRAIRWGEGDKLFEHFTRTRAIRRGILEMGQDTRKPDFGRSDTDKA